MTDCSPLIDGVVFRGQNQQCFIVERLLVKEITLELMHLSCQYVLPATPVHGPLQRLVFNDKKKTVRRNDY